MAGTGCSAHPTFYGMLARSSCSGVSRPGREADYLPVSNAEVGNDWSYKSTSLNAFPTNTGSNLLQFI